MKSFHVNAVKRCLFLTIYCLIAFGNGAASESYAQTAINGSLRQVGSQQILTVWGSNYEMGYAHGYLLADKIRDLVDTYVVGFLANGNASNYSQQLALIPKYHTFYPEYLNEINGIVDGMIASGKNMYVPSLKRNVDARDIEAFNLFIEYYFGCSSFGVWGTETANGETIIARNYDFFYDTQGNILKDQIVMAYEPTGKPKFVTFGWPGWYGIITGMNEYGVTVTTNAGNDNSSSGNGPFHPSTEVLRYILENTNADNFLYQPLSIVNSVNEFTPLIIQISTPYLGAGDPVYYIEDSADRNVIRNAADTDPAYDQIVATNHFIKLLPLPPSSDNSMTRYNTLRNGLIQLLGTGDHKVDSTEAWTLLDKVADIIAPTLTSIVVRPNRMEFDVSFAALVSGKFKSATDIHPQTYTWSSLFPADPLPDLVVLSIVPDLSYPAVGQPVNVTVTVKNQGGADSGGFTLGFYKNLAVAPTLQQAADGNCVKTGLAAGATDSCTFTVTYYAADSYKMWAQADTQQQVNEQSETNNVFGPLTITAGSSANLASLSLNPDSVTGGTASSGTVTLTGPAPTGGTVVSLSDNSSSASVPSTVTVPAGSSSTTFSIATTPVSSADTVTVTAMCNGVTKTSSLTIHEPALSSLTVTPTSVTGGTSSKGTVTLSGPAPGSGTTVLLSDNSSAASVPASVVVPSGSSSATFTISTSSVTSTGSATISAVYGGVTKTATLTVTPAAVTVAVSMLSLNPASVKGGATSQGTVTLSGPAPSGGATVTLSDNSSAAAVPASVVVAGGQTSATFTVTTLSTFITRSVTISAKYGGVTKTAVLTVHR